MKIYRVLLLPLWFLTSCATITRGVHEKLRIESDPSGANVVLSTAFGANIEIKNVEAIDNCCVGRKTARKIDKDSSKEWNLAENKDAAEIGERGNAGAYFNSFRSAEPRKFAFALKSG